MRHIAMTILGACLLVCLGLFSDGAKAGDSSGDARYRSGAVSNSSSCCYRKIVRQVRTVRYVPTVRYVRSVSYVRTVRYVRTDEGRSYDYDRPIRQSSYAPPRYVSDVSPRYVDDGYYDDGYTVSPRTCTWRREMIRDGRGGWVWGDRRRVCY